MNISSRYKKFDNNCKTISIEIFVIMTKRTNHDVVVLWFQHFEQLNKSKKIDKYLNYNSITANFSRISIDDYEKFFVKHKKASVIIKKLKQKMFKEFHEYINVWNSKLMNKISFRKKWNHVINFIQNVKSSFKKTYDFSKKQIIVVKKYIDDMLKKKYIKFNTSKYVAFVLIIKKLNDKLRVCMNYKTFNVFIIKNRNVSSLIKNTLIRVCSIKYYSKFDIIIAFIEIRMRQKNEKKNRVFY